MKRRDFIRNSFLIGAGFTFLPHPAPWIDKLQASSISSRIIDITDPEVLKNSSIDTNVLEKMRERYVHKHLPTLHERKVRDFVDKLDKVKVKD